MTYKKHFCTFSDSKMYRSLNRIQRQAEGMAFYDEMYFYNERNLDVAFATHFKNQMKFGSRGFGYWVWKPQVILQTFEKMEYGDILQYTDAGCHLNPNGKERLQEYFDKADKSATGILAFQSIEPEDENLIKQLILLEKHWTKGDLFDYFGVRNRKDIYNTEQIGAGILFIKKNKESIHIIKQWLQVYYDNFSLADNTPSTSPNFPGFQENRHDQSIFSTIAKLHNIPTLSSFEYWQNNFESLQQYPIHAKRDKDWGMWRMLNDRLFSPIKRHLMSRLIKK